MWKKILVIAALLITGPAFAEGVRIVIPARDIARGETLSLADLGYQTVVANSTAFGVISSADDIVGLEARRVLRRGETIRTSDLRRPVLVTKGATVTMTFEAPGITLTAVGRAMSEGGMGETVTIQNPNSFRQITATVTGPGQVRTGLSQLPARTASR